MAAGFHPLFPIADCNLKRPQAGLGNPAPCCAGAGQCNPSGARHPRWRTGWHQPWRLCAASAWYSHSWQCVLGALKGGVSDCLRMPIIGRRHSSQRRSTLQIGLRYGGLSSGMVSFSRSVVGKTASAMNEHHGWRFPNEGLKTREGCHYLAIKAGINPLSVCPCPQRNPAIAAPRHQTIAGLSRCPRISGRRERRQPLWCLCP